MLSIFGKYDEDAWAIVYSLAMSDISNLNISLEDDGFLPDDVTSPYEMLLGLGRNTPKNPLNINNLSLPLSYEVEFIDGIPCILDKSRVVARIELLKGKEERIVKSITYVGYNSEALWVDNYNKYGFLFKKDYYLNGVGLVSSDYFNSNGETVVSVNYIANSYVYTENSSRQNYSRVFYRGEDFLRFFLDKYNLDNQEIISDGGSFILEYLKKYKTKSYIIYSKPIAFDLPDYLKGLKDFNSQLILTNKSDYEKLVVSNQKEEILYCGLQFPIKSGLGLGSEVLITTGTDDIKNLEAIVSSCRGTNFHVAASTLMSDKLLSLDKYPNLTLYPAISKEKLISLFERCGVFLDIANSPTVFSANKLAVSYSCLRMGYAGISSGKYITSDLLFPSNSSGIVNILGLVKNDQDKLRILYDSQNVLLGLFDGSDFRNVIALQTS